ncbi:GDSL esterase/lipase At5g03610-like [Miscanthus floridulus]|uniref:GDSL esterase/lipase At5g03610-like n=1 Tax=Miscanthus floridulus TaxID=154761 RepID=UPI003458EFEC
MKPLAAIIIPVLVLLLVAMNAAHVESRRSGMMYQLYVFGDSYADTGNLPKSNLSRESRQWYKPYGTSSPSGRFSNRFVQSDFVASWLGHHEAPQTFRLRNRNDITRFGMNFAVAGSGVLEVPEKVATLSKQVDNFEGLIKDRTFPPWRLRFSLALIAISGNDYARIANMSSSNDTLALIETVTTGIAKEVQRLQDLGMNRILVNNMHPLGCTPFRTRPNSYTHCDDVANAVAATHNKLLAEKLGNYRGNVMLLDLNTAFSRVVHPNPNATGSDDETLAKTFKNKLRPSCESFDPKGYCGQEDENGSPQYSVTDDLSKDMFSNFYWDDVHPTHTGWFVAMMQLEEEAKAFLDLKN